MKLTLTTLAITVLATASSFATHPVQRIDHPNGQPTFAYAPHEMRSPTIAVYAGQRSFSTSDGMGMMRNDDLQSRPLVLHRGRGETIVVHTTTR